MARNRGNRSRRNNRRGRVDEDHNIHEDWSARGGRASAHHGSKFRRGQQHDKQNSHHQSRHLRHLRHHHHAHRHGQQVWNWQRDLDSEENDTTDSSDLDASQAGIVNLNQFPPAENNVFSLLLPSSSSRSAAAATNSAFRCLRADCTRIQKNLDWVKRRDRRLRRMIRLALEQLGPDLYDFLVDGADEESGEDHHHHNHDDEKDAGNESDSMDWTPEPTVNLVINAISPPTGLEFTPSLEYLPHEHGAGERTGLGIIWNTPPRPHQLPPEQQPSPLGASRQLNYQQLLQHQQQQQQQSPSNMARRLSPQLGPHPQSLHHTHYQQQQSPLQQPQSYQQQQAFRLHPTATNCAPRTHNYTADPHVEEEQIL
ncbi:hypothetical protein G7054_g14614 [Neopestalotiopsis clavispora]|nr:hypothetical protein G7054_g14614 [Neopestalotiopsis clavispora]